jgi:hypothetical protein
VYLSPELGEQRLDQITGEAVDRLFAKFRRPDTRPERRAKALTEKTVENIRATLAKVFGKAVEMGRPSRCATASKGEGAGSEVGLPVQPRARSPWSPSAIGEAHAAPVRAADRARAGGATGAGVG